MLYTHNCSCLVVSGVIVRENLYLKCKLNWWISVNPLNLAPLNIALWDGSLYPKCKLETQIMENQKPIGISTLVEGNFALRLQFAITFITVWWVLVPWRTVFLLLLFPNSYRDENKTANFFIFSTCIHTIKIHTIHTIKINKQIYSVMHRDSNLNDKQLSSHTCTCNRSSP